MLHINQLLSNLFKKLIQNVYYHFSNQYHLNKYKYQQIRQFVINFKLKKYKTFKKLQLTTIKIIKLRFNIQVHQYLIFIEKYFLSFYIQISQNNTQSVQQINQKVAKALEYLSQNVKLAEQVIESFSQLQQQNKEIPPQLALGFNSHYRQIKEQLRILKECFQTLAQNQQQYQISDGQLKALQNKINTFERKVVLIEQRAPTARQQQQQTQQQDTDYLANCSLNQIVLQLQQLKDQKNEEIDRLATNVKKLNGAANVLHETIGTSIEKIDGLIDTTKETTAKVSDTNTQIQTFNKKAKRDYFCWWLLADIILFAIMIMLIIFVAAGVPPKF